MNENRGLWHGKNADSGEWIEGYFAGYCYNDSQELVPHILNSDNWDIEEVIPETLGECTGLLDRSKQLIFEGDFLQNLENGKIGLVAWSDRAAGFVCRYGSDYYDTTGLIEIRAKRSRIIGNRHDSPELLTATGEDIGNAAQDTLAPAT